MDLPDFYLANQKSSIVRNVSRKIGIVNSRIMSGSPVGVYKVRTGAIQEKKCVKNLNRVLGLQRKEAVGGAGAWISRVGETDRK